MTDRTKNLLRNIASMNVDELAAFAVSVAEDGTVTEEHATAANLLRLANVVDALGKYQYPGEWDEAQARA